MLKRLIGCYASLLPKAFFAKMRSNFVMSKEAICHFACDYSVVREPAGGAVRRAVPSDFILRERLAAYVLWVDWEVRK